MDLRINGQVIKVEADGDTPLHRVWDANDWRIVSFAFVLGSTPSDRCESPRDVESCGGKTLGSTCERGAGGEW